PSAAREDDHAAGAALPRIDAAGGTLFLPFGSRIDYFLRLAPQSRIAIEEIVTSDPRAGLRISLRPEGEDEQVLGDLVGATGRWAAAVPAGLRWPIARVSFAALAQSESSSLTAGILLKRPVIETLSPDRAAGREGGPGGHVAPRANVIIYMTDAMRADHLGCYGYRRPTSPNIDLFAAQALLFENAIAQAPWTTSSVASMLTGVYPNTHHVTLPQHALPASLVTMGEILHDAGFMTAAFITNAAAGEAFGLARGFAEHRLLKASVDRESVHELSDRLNDAVFSWLDGRDDDGRPLFLYVHATDTHSPYTPPPEFARRFLDVSDTRDLDMPDGMPLLAEPGNPPAGALIDKLIDLYDAEIAFNDDNFGLFLSGLRDRELFDDSLIVFLSDHGEEFYEHGGWQHMRALYAESVRIPFIVKLPGAAASRRGRTSTLAQQVDLLPTVLAVLGLDVPPQVEGRDLIAALDPGEGGRPAQGFSYFDRRDRKGVSVVDGDWKMIQIRLQDQPLPAPELYNIARDPGEKLDLAAAQPEVLGYLRSVLDLHESAATGLAAGESEIDDELRRELKALGYLD
ncbi:MAG TPA: sulfatase, partial [Candidatus Polarisedimenticolia bacterium]|nr:sulfatase [Candidatus Polarisedimenticolia bacterium]